MYTLHGKLLIGSGNLSKDDYEISNYYNRILSIIIFDENLNTKGETKLGKIGDYYTRICFANKLGLNILNYNKYRENENSLVLSVFAPEKQI